jgi:hypothetical protein
LSRFDSKDTTLGVCVCVYIQVVKREIQTRPSAVQEMLSIQDVELNLFSFFPPLLL